jgi:ABC-type lipoprotein export system ATPase subunit
VPDKLSGGQRQRVSIARAVIHRPSLLLADEPTGALDARNAAVVIDLLLEVGQDLGATLVVATHDRTAAQRMGRIVELHDGVVTADLWAATRAG